MRVLYFFDMQADLPYNYIVFTSLLVLGRYLSLIDSNILHVNTMVCLDSKYLNQLTVPVQIRI